MRQRNANEGVPKAFDQPSVYCVALLAAKPQRATRLVVRAEEAAAAAVPKAAPKKEVGPKRGSFVS